MLEASAPTGFALATDVAELLVKNGVAVPRGARGGRATSSSGAPSTARSCTRSATSELAHVSPHLTPDVRSVLDVRGAIAARDGHGGTAPVRVQEQLDAVALEVAAQRRWAAGTAD